MNRENQRLLAHLESAKAYSKLSHARRLKVGAVLVRDDRIISVGYNGTPSGRDNNCEIVIMRTLDGPFVEKELKTKPEVCHAEMNVIAFAAKYGVATNNCSMIVTHSPCFECSKLMIQAGIKEVYYENEYRIKDGINFLKECDVNVQRIEEKR